MSIDTRFTPAIRSALLEQMQYQNDRHSQEVANSPGSDTARGTGTDSVSLSADALRIHAAVNVTAGQDVFDVERVAEIRQALVTGSYHIDPIRLADKFHQFNSKL